MIQKKIIKHTYRELSTVNEDLQYWLSRSAEERVSAVEYLRKQYDGSSARLQRTAKVIQRKTG